MAKFKVHDLIYIPRYACCGQIHLKFQKIGALGCPKTSRFDIVALPIHPHFISD
jgi:hypothetical protein